MSEFLSNNIAVQLEFREDIDDIVSISSIDKDIVYFEDTTFQNNTNISKNLKLVKTIVQNVVQSL